MTDKDMRQWMRAVLFRLVELHEIVMTTSLALAESGTVNREAFDRARSQALAHWKYVREQIEKLDEQSDTSLAELLKNFEGPIQ